MPAKQSDFEKSLAELEKIVRRMEQGEQPLEQALKDFERGMALAAQCRKSLEAAQQRVDKLVKKHGRYAPEAMRVEEEEGEYGEEFDDGDGESDGDYDGDSDYDGDDER